MEARKLEGMGRVVQKGAGRAMVNMARIRYITSHFNVLKGLTVVPWGIYYLLGAGFDLWVAPWQSDVVLFAALWAGCVVAGLIQLLLLVYYGRALGYVSNPIKASRTLPATNVRYKL